MELDLHEFKFRKYSQCGEDKIIELIFQMLSIDKPSWLDIGAGDPIILSNTALFYEKGCRGINIEPNPDFYAKLCEARPEDTNLNCGVGVEAGTMNYYVIDNYPFLNGFSEENSEKMEKEFGYRIKEAIPVRIMPIDELINKYCSLEYPDILDIDTEGMDLDILSRIDYDRFSPKVIIVETVIFGSFRKDTTIKEYLSTKGYAAPYETPMNTIFVRNDCWEKML